MTIDETWVAWTEQEGQDVVAERRRANGMRLAALRGALERLARSDEPTDQIRAATVSETLDFLGGPLAFSKKTDEAMRWVTDPARNPKFWSPGDLIERPWLGGVRVRVLGPPKDKKALNKLEGDVGTDMYDMRFAMSGDELAFAMAVAAGPQGNAWLPFDAALQWRDEARWLARFSPEFQQEYREARWRRADTDWLGSAADLALQLDNPPTTPHWSWPSSAAGGTSCSSSATPRSAIGNRGPRPPPTSSPGSPFTRWATTEVTTPRSENRASRR
jgi:hypothetical protein